MAGVAMEFAEKGGDTPIVDVHMLGAAFPASVSAESLEPGFRGNLYNYMSTEDKVLSSLYRLASAGGRASGAAGFEFPSRRVINVDVTDIVPGHRDYVTNVNLLSR